MEGEELGRTLSLLPIGEQARRARPVWVSYITSCELRKHSIWDLFNFLHLYASILEKILYPSEY